MQLIQTTSILIQNITKEQDSIYLLSHPFLNKIISYDFDLAGHSEVVDYFISFLKMLSLKINKNSIQFFYNKRFKNFPLYGTAVKLYNHQESMVRTAARTITLTVYSIRNQEIINAVLSLPHASYFPHMA
jgi:protein CLEC16A